MQLALSRIKSITGHAGPFQRLATLKDNTLLIMRYFIRFLSKSWSTATLMIMDVVENGCTMRICGFRISVTANGGQV